MLRGSAVVFPFDVSPPPAEDFGSWDITGTRGESSSDRLLELLSFASELFGAADVELPDTIVDELEALCAAELELLPFSKLELEAETITTSILLGKSSPCKGITIPKARVKPAR